MKRKLLSLLIILIMIFSLCSCEVYTYATTQDDIYVEAQADIIRSNVDFNVVIQYGTPYYYNGSILYYLYRDLYYYPFYYNNYWYVRAYRRPFNHLNYRPYFRPHRYDYRFAPGSHKGFDRPKVTPNRPTPNRVTPSSQTPSRQAPSRINPNRTTPNRVTPSRQVPNRTQQFGGSRR